MKVGYTEFSFGYAFTENLIRASSLARPTGAPVFPNLIQEATLGYDVNINLPACPLFFQYKIPELMVRNTAAEISQYALSGIAVPFFRMPMMRQTISQQHPLLMELERRLPGAVYYASPGIENVDSFNAAYNLAQIHEQSVLFSPGDIGSLPDDKFHAVAYRNGLAHAYFCSDPRMVTAFNMNDIRNKLDALFNEQRFESLELAAKIIQREILSLAPQRIRDLENDIRARIRARRVALADRPDLSERVLLVSEDLLVSREIARVYYGADMVIAQPRGR